MKKKFWKKGDKVIRLYGSNHWGRTGAMMPGDIGTLAENQKYPGVVKLKEFPDAVGHDVIRLRRLKDFKKLNPKFLVHLWELTDGRNFDIIAKLFNKVIK